VRPWTSGSGQVVQEDSGLRIEGYSMHSCVHSWTVHVLNQEWDSGMANLALECVGSHVPGQQRSANSWVTRRRLIATHAARCWSFVVYAWSGLDDDGKDGILHSFG
jgi:hypothetical protein